MNRLITTILAAALTLTSYNASADNWATSVGISIGNPNGRLIFETTNAPGVVYVQPNVVYLPPSHVVYPAYVPPVIVPCYNCGQYPQGDPRDPYRNHHHLQRYPYYNYHFHYHYNR